MKIGIIAAMEQELVLLVEQLENKVEETILGNTYYTGRLGKHDVVLVQSGVGKVMSAMSVAVLADHFEVEALINTGSAGAVAPLAMITAKCLCSHYISRVMQAS